MCYGRLNSLDLKQRTRLDWRYLLRGLTVLIQYHLIYWYTSDDGYTTYEVNLEAALALAKSGSYITPVQDRFGSVERKIVNELMLLGHATVDDICHAVLETDRIHGQKGRQDENDKGRTGDAVAVGDLTATDERVSHKVRQAMLNLTQGSIIKTVNESHFRSSADNYTEVLRELPSRGLLDKALNKNEKTDFDLKVTKILDNWREGTAELSKELAGIQAGHKRLHHGSQMEQPTKKRRVTKSLQISTETGTDSFNELTVCEEEAFCHYG